MALVMADVTIGTLRMQLWESDDHRFLHPRYSLICSLTHDPIEVSVIFLSRNRFEALEIFSRKVRSHQARVAT